MRGQFEKTDSHRTRPVSDILRAARHRKANTSTPGNHHVHLYTKHDQGKVCGCHQ